MAWLPGDTETSLSLGQKLELQNKAILGVRMNVSKFGPDMLSLLAVMGSLMLGWISSYVVSAFQFSVILWDSGVEVLSRHPCFVGSYYFKAIVIFWVIIQAGYNSILRHFLTRCNSSFHQQVICLSMVKAKRYTITANQNIFYGACTLEKVFEGKECIQYILRVWKEWDSFKWRRNC